MIFGHEALGNNIQILLFPSSWLFEAQEAWVTSNYSIPSIDYELVQGKKIYATNLTGAYYAAKLPVLEYLKKIRRQAGAIVFIEVYKEWIPLGVWRFREICREALKKTPLMFDIFEKSLDEISTRLRLPLDKWLQKSEIISWHKKQRRISSFFS